MSNISDNIRTTILSLKQISDRIKLALTNITSARLDIKGADSKNVEVIGTDVLSCGEWSKGGDLGLRDIIYENGKYKLAALSSYEETDIYPGKVLRVDDTEGESYMLIKSVDTSVLHRHVNAEKDENDNYYLVDDYVTEAIPVEPGKNYVCTDVVVLQDGFISGHFPLIIDTATIRGTLYFWKEYEGDSIHDAKEEILDALGDIQIDTSELAKQGDDPDVSLTTLDEQLGDVADALDYMEQGGMPVIDDIAKQGSNAAANISTIQANIGTPASGQPATLFAAIAAGGGGGGSSTPQIAVNDSVTSIELQPNTLYIFTNRTANLTITLAAGQQNVVNEYHMFIEIGATVPTITWPNNLNWVMPWDPGINSNVEISILNNSVIWV